VSKIMHEYYKKTVRVQMFMSQVISGIISDRKLECIKNINVKD
jgi:hypothetical protein